MPKRDWFGNAALAIIAFAALLAISGIVFGLWSETFLQKRRAYSEYQEHAENYQRDASQDIAEACIGIANSPAAFRACIEDQVKAYDAYQIGDDDLRAQQDMALWAFWMVLISSGGIGVTIVGIYYVRETLEANRLAVGEARRANDDASKASHAELRAYVSVTLIEITETTAKYQPNIRIKVKNFGQTPAKNLIHRPTFKFHRLGTPLSFNIGGSTSGKMDLAPGQDMVKTMLVPNGMWDVQKPLLIGNETSLHRAELYVFGDITYDTAFEKGRVTRYRVKWDVDDEGIKDSDAFRLCPEGNEMT